MMAHMGHEVAISHHGVRGFWKSSNISRHLELTVTCLTYLFDFTVFFFLSGPQALLYVLSFFLGDVAMLERRVRSEKEETHAPDNS